MGRRKGQYSLGRNVVGFYTDRLGRKRPITRPKGHIKLPRLRMYVIQQPITRRVNSVLSTLSMMFPQFSPIFEGARVILGNRNFFSPFLKTIFSDESSQEKIKTIERNLQRKVKREAISEFSRTSARMISHIVEERIGFYPIVKEIGGALGEVDANVFQIFFQDTLQKLIEESALRVV